MKKLLTYIFLVVILFSLLVCPVNAEILSVKTANVCNYNCIVVLRENGDLLFSNDLDTQNPQVLINNICDFNSDYYNNTFTIFALHTNGNITKIYFSEYSNKDKTPEINTFSVNAKKICYIGGLSYINNDDELIYTYSDPIHSAFDVKIPNIKKVFNTKSYYNGFYAISNDDVLYKFMPNGNKETDKNEIMTNVKDCIVDNNLLLVLRNNADLYSIQNDNTPERIAQNIEDINDVTIASYGGMDKVYCLDKDGNLYQNGNIIRTDISKIYKTMESYGEIYYITANNDLYYLNAKYKDNDYDYFQHSDVAEIMGNTRYFYKGLDGHLYNKEGYQDKYSALYLKNIKDVIKYDKLGDEDDRYLFITNNGELWGSFGDTWDTPFLTSFCQKKTIVKINRKEVELTAKIQVVNDRSMYPFRECLENMGAKVMWDNTNKIAIGEYNGNTIEFPIGKSEYYVNGVRHEMDTESYIDNSIGRTYIPIRYAAEGLGFTVEWIEGNSENTIDIHK